MRATNDTLEGLIQSTPRPERIEQDQASTIGSSSTALTEAVDRLESIVARAMLLLDRPSDGQFSAELRQSVSDAVAQIGAVGPSALSDAKRRYAFGFEFAKLRDATGRHFARRGPGAEKESKSKIEGSLKGLELATIRFVGWVRAHEASYVARAEAG